MDVQTIFIKLYNLFELRIFLRSKHYIIILCLFTFLVFGNKKNYEISPINDLSNFEMFIGKKYIGIIENKKNDTIGHEVVKWELALRGHAIKLYQYINETELVGESIIMFDEDNDQFSCWYFSSGGVSRKSKLLYNNKQIIFIEDVSKNKNSITKIRTKYEFIKNDTYEKNIQFLINNVWTKGSNIIYKELLK